MHRQRTDTSPDASGLECSVEVARVDGKSVTGGEDKSRADPEGPGCRLRLRLGLLLQPEGRAADVRQWQERIGGLGLGLAMHQAAANSLEPVADLDLRGVEVHHLPGQPEHLATSQAQHQDQDVCRVERVALVAGCLLYTSDAADDLLCVD